VKLVDISGTKKKGIPESYKLIVRSEISEGLYRGISDFKSGTNTVTDEKGDLVTDSHSILFRWRNHFSQLLNVCGVIDFSQTEIHATETLVPELSACEFEMAIEKLKRDKSPGFDQIPAELIKPRCRSIF